jgi:capsular polysaccharide transport system permease protein
MRRAARAFQAGRAAPLSRGGFQAQRGARAMRAMIVLSFALLVAIPTLGSALYYTFLASDQYVAEAQFTVAGREVRSNDGVGALTGIPAIAILQDTHIVMSYVQSRAAVEKLEKMRGLRQVFGNPNIDYLARFDSDDPVEKLVRYWKRMTQVGVKMPSGIVEFKVRAFTPRAALDLADAVVRVSEDLVNEMNGKMFGDAVRTAEQELERASKRLTDARLNLEKARNDEGLLDASRTAEALGKLITETRAGMLQLQQGYTGHLRAVSEQAPQMKALKARIDAARDQIADLEATLTASQARARPSGILSASFTRFAQLDLERQIAERLYAGAASSLEIARLTSENKMMYLNTFVKPVLPEEPQYPRRILYPAMILLAGLAAWGAVTGLAYLVRNHMA